MKEVFKDLIIDLLKNFAGKRVRENQWKSLFVDTGELLTAHINYEAAFQEDLQSLFSEENMRALAEKTESTSGYELI